MKLRDRTDKLDPKAERELEAIEQAIAGERVDPDLAAWAELVEMLRDERPEPQQEWSAELDDAAARRFRRGVGSGSSARDLADRLRELLPVRIAGPAGALATLAVVAVVAVTTIDRGSDPTMLDTGEPAITSVSNPSTSAASSSKGAVTDQFQEAAPADASAGSAGLSASSADSSVGSLPSPTPGSDLPIAPGTEKRQIDRNVQLQLSTRPDEVRDVSNQVISITRSLDGIVANSQVNESGRDSSATLALTIPTRNLDTAIDQLTELGNVDSLQEQTEDITKPYVSAQDRLRDAEAERRSLLDALSNASTDAEADALKLQIADSRREISRARSAFENVARQSRLSDLSVTVSADPNAPEQGRSLGDWLDDSIDVLRAIAGVLLISAAILVPLGTLIAIAWFTVSRLRRSRRERALG